MQRRTFLKNTGKAGLGYLVLNGTPIKALAQMPSSFTCQQVQGRIVVMINLFGANDTLNTVVPKMQYNIYNTNRPTIKIPEAALITLDTANNVNPTTLHPIMTPFKDLYDQGKLNVVHGVGYLNNNRSHFKSDDLWNTAGDTTPSNFNLDSGWAGQLFEYRYPGLLGSTAPTLPDPPCIELGSTSGSILFQTATNNNASVLLTNNNVSSFYNTLINVGGPSPDAFATTDNGLDIKYIDDIQKLSSSYGLRIQTVFNAGSNTTGITYPNTSIANQLKTVARLIKGGSKTSMYMVHQYGFDTHGSQTDTTDPTTGTHTNLLRDLTIAIKAFQDDITALGFEDSVITTTHSEFGRTIDENGGRGTDHGGVSTMFIIGKGVQGGITGTPINLTLVDNRGLTDLQYDYRRVWASVMQDFMGHGPAPMAAARLQNFTATKAPIIAASHIAAPACYINQISLPITLASFNAQLLIDGNGLLKWKTTTEINCKEYQLEHSTNGTSYTAIGKVLSAGNTNTIRNYQFNHNAPNIGVNYYRLWQVDFNGASKMYGPVVLKVINNTKFAIKAYPNPATTNFNVVFTTTQKQQGYIAIYDVQGHLLHKQPVVINEGITKFNFTNAHIKNAKGQLIIHFIGQGGVEKTLKQLVI